jgi:hypothetical protein
VPYAHPNVGFCSGNVGSMSGLFGGTRHQFSLQIQSIMPEMSGMSGFYRRKEFPKKSDLKLALVFSPASAKDSTPTALRLGNISL